MTGLPNLPEWVWLVLGGSLFGFLASRLWGRGKRIEGAQVVQAATDAAADRQQAEAETEAEADHAAATEDIGEATSAINAAGITELASLVNETFNGGEDD